MQSSKMKIAIPMWNGCVSSVFDFAHQLLVVDVKDRKEINRSQIQLEQQAIQQRASRLAEMKIDVLICGTISWSLASMLMASNIEVIPFVTGTVDKVLNAYFDNQLAEPQFLQPGCESGARKRFCRRYEGRCGRGRRHRGGWC